jgi:hypoxanthine phosphoribosyltransferase
VDVKKIYLDDARVRSLSNKIGREILMGDWRPDYIVGISRGGLIPAVLLSHYLGTTLHTLKVTLRDGLEEDCDHNCWMAEDALGYSEDKKNILIVDDINDSGATFGWIKQDWMSSALPKDDRWSTIWGHNVRFAVLVHNAASDETSDYAGMEINKAENPSWVVFPWEEWWAR